MSRGLWFDGGGSLKREVNGEYLKEIFDSNTRTTLQPTNDPAVKLWEEAIELFEDGTRLARQGDLATGGQLIACAFLLDNRSITYFPICKESDGDPYKNQYIDYELLCKLMEPDETSFAPMVLRIMWTLLYGENSDNRQTVISDALQAAEGLLETIKLHPDLGKKEDSTINGYIVKADNWFLTRPVLLYQRASLYMTMGNIKKSMEDLTEALALDENYISARMIRANMWAYSHIKHRKVVHKEFKRLIKEVHPDHRHNEVYYAWLAITTLDDPSLGTREDATTYYKKSLMAQLRRNELYGSLNEDDEPPVLQDLDERFLMSPEQIPSFLRSFAQVKNGLDGISHHESKDETPKVKDCCVNCGISEDTSTKGKLMQCSRCKLAYYCSKECQRADWKKHKVFCKKVGK
mmetsp:Transcript_5810/g.8719  ORF Transcript_5810/g.8719 Transcript_5810/m.8719 type:complete len:406 (+) Transcript_5810:58-1275(+)